MSLLIKIARAEKLPQTKTVKQWQFTTKTAPFSGVGVYNHHTTLKPVIYQFSKKFYLVNPGTPITYKKVKTWRRIQWPVCIPYRKVGNSRPWMGFSI
jgi:hypothetical protein